MARLHCATSGLVLLPDLLESYCGFSPSLTRLYKPLCRCLVPAFGQEVRSLSRSSLFIAACSDPFKLTRCLQNPEQVRVNVLRACAVGQSWHKAPGRSASHCRCLPADICLQPLLALVPLRSLISQPLTCLSGSVCGEPLCL